MSWSFLCSIILCERWQNRAITVILCERWQNRAITVIVCERWQNRFITVILCERWQNRAITVILCERTISPQGYHTPSSQCFYHWVDTSTGGLLVLESIIHPVVSVSITESIPLLVEY